MFDCGAILMIAGLGENYIIPVKQLSSLFHVRAVATMGFCLTKPSLCRRRKQNGLSCDDEADDK